MYRSYWALFDSEVGYINTDGTSDWSDISETDIAGDSLAPAAPIVLATSKPNAIELTLTPPTTNADGTTCVDFKEYIVYYSDSGSIDTTDSGSYTGVYTVSGSKTEETTHSHPATATTYFVVTAADTSGNASEASGEVSKTPDAAQSVTTNYVPNPFFAIDSDGDGLPDDWALQAGWERAEDAFQGSYSIRGQGSGVSAISTQVTLPVSSKGLTVSGVAKTTGTSFTLTEIATEDTTSAPIAYTDASGNIAAIARQKDSYDIIELWDITDPTTPYMIGSIDSSGDSSHRSKPFKIYGDYLICGNQSSNHLYIYNISDPSSPTLTEDYTLANASGRLAALAIRDWYVYACCDDATNGGFIEVVNIVTPASTSQADQIDDVSGTFASFRGADAKNTLLCATIDDSVDDWEDPSGYEDSESAWDNETNAYDGDSDTYAATADTIPQGNWSDYLVFTIGPHWSTQVRFDAFTTSAGGELYVAIDVDVYDGSSWTDVYYGAFTNHTATTKTFTGQIVTKARVRFYNGHGTSWNMKVYEFDFYPESSRMVAYNIADPTALSLSDTYSQDGLKAPIINGQHVYASCDAGADENKIVVLSIADPTDITYVTAVGGAGTPNYTGTDALFLSGGYLVNVGAGSDAGKYAVSYWNLGSPDLPAIKSVEEAFTGDMDAADEAGGLIIGVDVDNSKVRIVDPKVSADWEFRVAFYDVSGTLVESIVAYDGNYDVPLTGEDWTAFSQVIPEADVPDVAKTVAFICYCNESTGYIYVDSLKAEFV
ncbi:MAG: hypothetical protein PHF64_00010 [Methanoregula sp.]|nr:hypothetical protein [Methanoregula sp.]